MPRPKNPQSQDQQALATEAAIRGRQAQRLLEDPLLTEAFTTLKDTYTKAWQASDYADLEGRERAFRMIHAIEKLQQQLHEVVLNGKIEGTRVRNTVAGK